MSQATSLYTDERMAAQQLLGAQCLKGMLPGDKGPLPPPEAAYLDGGVHHLVTRGDRPVDQVQVQVVQLQILQGLPAGLQGQAARNGSVQYETTSANHADPSGAPCMPPWDIGLQC